MASKCVCVYVYKRVGTTHTGSADATTYITKDYSCPRSCGLLGQRRRDSGYPEKLTGFILRNKSTNPLSDMFIDNIRFSSVSYKEKQSKAGFTIFSRLMCRWKDMKIKHKAEYSCKQWPQKNPGNVNLAGSEPLLADIV